MARLRFQPNREIVSFRMYRWDMPFTERTTGRPRNFDPADVIERALDVFWRNGFGDTTTRMLEAELGMTQSSIYNAFGSKQRLLELGLDRYEEQLDRTVVEPLASAPSSPNALADFVDRLVIWVSNRDRPGCFLLNLAGETAHANPGIIERAAKQRAQLRSVFIETLSASGLSSRTATSRADLLLIAVLGLNISARAGASSAELGLLAEALKCQIEEWLAT